MLKWAITFLILALISALFGFGLVANLTFSIAKILFYIFIALFVISLIFGKQIFRTQDR